jgi:cation diffusion facilitator family transporter
MRDQSDNGSIDTHSHVFLGIGHEQNERKTWGVIVLCSVMMLVEIIGGSLFGSLALVADGLHMSTHAGAMLIAAVAYTYARRHENDPRFGFGTGKLGDLAGFSSAIVLAMIALLIAYEAVARLFSPVPIHFTEAIPIAVIGLGVNIVSAWLLSGDHHGHSHGHSNHTPHHDEELQRIQAVGGNVEISVYEEGVPPRFRLVFEGPKPAALYVSLETIRPDGARQNFAFADRGAYLESMDEIPEPHEFQVLLQLPGERHALAFAEHGHQDDDHAMTGSASTHRDNSIRSAYIHVIADAAVSVLAIAGLILARSFGWVWMDPVAGMIGALVIANWSFGLTRDTAGVLLDVVPDRHMQDQIRKTVEDTGDQLVDLHLWRLGPGHLGLMLSVVTKEPRAPAFYRAKLERFKALSHVTVEVQPYAH